jgi:regulatory protein
MKEIDEAEYRKTLAQLLESKERTLSEKNAIRKKFKLLSYAAAKGYEKELIMEILHEDL